MDCTICLEHIDKYPNISLILCHHLFHLHCIKQWNEISRTCPICRQTLLNYFPIKKINKTFPSFFYIRFKNKSLYFFKFDNNNNLRKIISFDQILNYKINNLLLEIEYIYKDVEIKKIKFKFFYNDMRDIFLKILNVNLNYVESIRI